MWEWVRDGLGSELGMLPINDNEAMHMRSQLGGKMEREATKKDMEGT